MILGISKRLSLERSYDGTSQYKPMHKSLNKTNQIIINMNSGQRTIVLDVDWLLYVFAVLMIAVGVLMI